MTLHWRRVASDAIKYEEDPLSDWDRDSEDE